MSVLRFERPRRHLGVGRGQGKPGRVTAFWSWSPLVLIALWLGYGALAERWPAIDLFNGLGVHLLLGRDSAPVWHSPAGRFVALDGDTLRAPDHDRIRVLGVDTPELHPCRCARECELGERAPSETNGRRTQVFLDGGPVSLQLFGRDRPGFPLGAARSPPMDQWHPRQRPRSRRHLDPRGPRPALPRRRAPILVQIGAMVQRVVVALLTSSRRPPRQPWCG